ncbi:MAG: TRAP transporter small permease [Betaproteobacteria bacterium]|nr:TRAP transporter small permease [Betaproteobacteria bacterium]NDD11497.1 TRAP transporter small permease [Betaproteobacteria bacterium]
MEKLIQAYEGFYRRFIPYLIAVPLVIMTVVIFINVIGRKLSIPFPVTVELVEALLVVSVYFGVALVALEGGHVNVTFATEKFSLRTKFFIEGLGHLLAAGAFVFLSVSAWTIAQASISVWEYRLAVLRFPLWPFKVLFAFGLTLMAVQLVFNAIKAFYLSSGRESYAGITSMPQAPDPGIG